MATFSQGGTLGTAIETGEVVDAAITLAKLAATAKPTTYVREAKTVIPRVNYPEEETGDALYDSLGIGGNTTQWTSQLVVPAYIKVNKISIWADSVNVAGTHKLAIYTEDGQTLLASVTTASVSAGGVVTTSLASELELAIGVYYFAILPQDTGSANWAAWKIDDGTAGNLGENGVSSEPIPCGKVTVTADTLATTFDPTALTVATGFPVVRLDN